MKFELIDIDKWKRREYYEHYTKEVICSYSMTVNIDISNLRNQKLYPTMLWLLTKTVNEFPEFRTALTEKGLGIFDTMLPAYTIFNKENKNFSVIYSEYSLHIENSVFPIYNSHFADLSVVAILNILI